MIADFQVVLDACVLIPMPLADTLLRLAETPRLYRPRWSDEIMTEVRRNLVAKIKASEQQAAYREKELRKHFAEAWVEGYKPLVRIMTNDEKDRHVLAAAVRCNAEVIVSYNQKHFPTEALEPYGIVCQPPSTFLKHLYHLSPALVVKKLHEQASDIDRSFEDLLSSLSKPVPGFVRHLCSELSLDDGVILRHV